VKLFAGQVNDDWVYKSKFNEGNIWESYNQLVSLAMIIFKLTSPKRSYPRAKELAENLSVRRSQHNTEELQNTFNQIRLGEKVSKQHWNVVPFNDEMGILRSRSWSSFSFKLDLKIYERRETLILFRNFLHWSNLIASVL
jgi:hypothetical protein